MRRFYRDERLGATHLNEVVVAVERAQPYGDVVSTPHGSILPYRRRVISDDASTTTSYDPWWYTLNPDGDNAAEVEIAIGEWTHGVRAIMEAAATKIVLTADHQYVWTSHVLNSGTVTIEGPSPTKPVCSAADSTLRFWLWQFRLVSGIASPERRGYIGNIIIPGTFA
jgi:hypothetical protein